MNCSVYKFLLNMVAVIAVCTPLEAIADPIPIANGGFESVDGTGKAVGWRIDPDASRGGVTVEMSTDVAHSGSGSLHLAGAVPSLATMLSEPVSLRVGHLYRLSGWIRSRGLMSDPTARYPTAVPSCLSMESFPFTNHSPAVGGDSEWTHVETLFIATRSKDRVRLHLGHNGTATGRVWFDDVRVEKVEDITEFIPAETVRWYGDGYRYDDRGWIFVHVEGEPYDRGYQYGALVADEIVDYITKLAYQRNPKDPTDGWRSLRFETDALFLRGYDKEFLTEMRGIADGAAQVMRSTTTGRSIC